MRLDLGDPVWLTHDSVYYKMRGLLDVRLVADLVIRLYSSVQAGLITNPSNIIAELKELHAA